MMEGKLIHCRRKLTALTTRTSTTRTGNIKSHPIPVCYAATFYEQQVELVSRWMIVTCARNFGGDHG